jgi:DNA-binding Lrp family transcriptional regulator
MALLNPAALEAGALFMLGIVLDRWTPESFAECEKEVQKVSGCMECHVVTGAFDYFMLIRIRDGTSLNQLHAEQLLYLPGVRQIRSNASVKQQIASPFASLFTCIKYSPAALS